MGVKRMPNEIIQALEQQMNGLTKLQKKVADYILKETMDAAFSTVDHLAHSVDVSTTTVVRLALSLGYSGYAEFQRDLQEHLKTKSAPSKKFELNISEGVGNCRQTDIIDNITQLAIDNINKVYSSLNRQQLTIIAERLAGANHIYVIGSRSCHSIAYHLNYNLDRMFGNSDVISTNSGELPEQLRRITSKDVVVAASMSRYVRLVVDIARICKERGAFVVSISDGYNSPLAQYSDILLLAQCGSVDFHNSMVSASYLVDIILGICAMNNPSEVRDNLKRTEKHLTELNIMQQR